MSKWSGSQLRYLLAALAGALLVLIVVVALGFSPGGSGEAGPGSGIATVDLRPDEGDSEPVPRAATPAAPTVRIEGHDTVAADDATERRRVRLRSRNSAVTVTEGYGGSSRRAIN